MRMRYLRKPVIWVVLFVLAWITLVIVQIAMGMGTAPGVGTPRNP
jgi:hypothetical protein